MNGFMALSAKGQAVIDSKAEIGIFGKWFDVMRNQIPSSIIAAKLAGEMISDEDIETPTLIKSGKPYSSPFFRFSIFVGRALFATKRNLPDGNAYFCSGIQRAWNSLARIWLSLMGSGQLTSSLSGVMLPHKGGNTSFYALAFFHPTTRKTSGIYSIRASSIITKLGNKFPCLAACTPLETCGNFELVLFNGHTSVLGGSLQCALFGLCHV